MPAEYFPFPVHSPGDRFAILPFLGVRVGDKLLSIDGVSTAANKAGIGIESE